MRKDAQKPIERRNAPDLDIFSASFSFHVFLNVLAEHVANLVKSFYAYLNLADADHQAPKK